MVKKTVTDSKKSAVKNKKKKVINRGTYRVPQPDYTPPDRPKVGGKYPPPPKKPLSSKLSDYSIALNKLNEDLVTNITFVMSVRDDAKNGYHLRLKAAEILLKRTMPEIRSIHKIDETPDSGYTDDQLKEMAKIYSVVTNQKPIIKRKKT